MCISGCSITPPHFLTHPTICRHTHSNYRYHAHSASWTQKFKKKEAEELQARSKSLRCASLFSFHYLISITVTSCYPLQNLTRGRERAGDQRVLLHIRLAITLSSACLYMCKCTCELSCVRVSTCPYVEWTAPSGTRSLPWPPLGDMETALSTTTNGD